jgi:leucyl aminopeptidase
MASKANESFYNGDLTVFFADDSKRLLSKVLDSQLQGEIQHAIKLDFKGKLKESLVLYPSVGPKRVLVVGLGSMGKLSTYSIRSAAAVIISQAKSMGVTKDVQVALPGVKKLTAEEVAQALTEGFALSQVNFHEFKTQRKEEDKARFTVIAPEIIVSDKRDLKAVESGTTRGRIIGEGVNWARHLILTPGSHLTPAKLAASAQSMAKTHPAKAKLNVEVWTEKELAKHKFGGVLGVGQGSANPPRFIIVEYMNGKKTDAPVILVGKGITFDSGGLSLKPPQGQETMKYDMAGSASVLGAIKIIAELGVKANVVALVPSAENMPSGTAIRPGDILHMASGKTVEVLNTDAEGRLILADALHWATTHYKPRAVLDVATLTGACAAALGDAAVGVFANSKKLLQALQKSSHSTQENIWELPNFPEVYKPLLKSDIADLKNIGGPKAGASTASLFLEEFIASETPWAHFDIAGAGWYDSPRDFIAARGPSGIPIRLMVDFVENFHASKFN